VPNYQSHCAINVLALGGLAYLATSRAALPEGQLLLSGVSFAAATFFLSPDLDLKHSSPTRNWGLLRWAWRPYQLLFKHRGLSHSLLFSSLTRVGYLLTLALLSMTLGRVVLGSAAVDDAARLVVDVGRAHLGQLTAVGAGILLSDLCHIVTDRLATALRALLAV
jgi:uncharacterized metal-binding protein